MNYGNGNDVTNQCGRCNKTIDSHKPFNIIRSASGTENFANKLQKALDAINARSLLKGFDATREQCMVGVIQTRLKGGRIILAATVSGHNDDCLNHIKKSPFGGVQFVVGGNVDRLMCYNGGEIISNNAQPPPVGRGRDYPVGSCAAQKLLNYIFRNHRENVVEIEMAEIFWTGTSTHNRDWSTGTIVQSCDTCKKIVPMMLCSAVE